LALHAVAFVDDQLSAALEPSVMEAGLTEKLTVGAGGATVTVAEPDLDVS
jgi:hypothetical protein